jgi:hypothetical protein
VGFGVLRIRLCLAPLKDKKECGKSRQSFEEVKKEMVGASGRLSNFSAVNCGLIVPTRCGREGKNKGNDRAGFCGSPLSQNQGG